MGRPNPIKNPAFPLLVGLDHNDNSLIPKAKEIVEQLGKKGKTLFIEGTALRERSDPKCDPFDAAALKAAEKGMPVIKLDRPRILKLREKLQASDPWEKSIESRHTLYTLREKRWIRITRKRAKGGDLVMMHQVHLARVLRELHPFGFGQNVLFVSKVKAVPKLVRLAPPPLSKKEISELKGIRAARRAINIRRKK